VVPRGLDCSSLDLGAGSFCVSILDLETQDIASLTKCGGWLCRFKEVDTKLAFPALEQSVAQWWKERGIIKQSLESGDRTNPFIFFEGPPTANGRPGVHHVEARVTKDLIVRYQRMRGRHVIGARRRLGYAWSAG